MSRTPTDGLLGGRHGAPPAPTNSRHGAPPDPTGPRHGAPPAPTNSRHGALPDPNDRAAISLDGASVRLGGRTIWSEVSLRVDGGEFVALLGANGAGKSTLLNVLLGTLPISGGTATVLGRAPGRAGSRIGYLPQRRAFAEGMPLRGTDVVRLGLDGERWGVPLPFAPGARARERRAQARQRVQEAIEMVDAGSYAERSIGSCSGGEQQRLLIAQALVRRPELFLLDEPLDGLDLPNQASVAALVHRIARETGVTVVLVAHDVNPLLPYLDRVVYLAGGRAASGTVEEVITTASLSALYGMDVEVLRAGDGRLVVVGAPDAQAHHHDRHEHVHAT